MADRTGLAKTGFYFAGVDDADVAGLLSAARQQAEAYGSVLPDGVDQRLGVLITKMPVLPHQRLMADSPKPFTAAYELSAADSSSLPAMECAVGAMGQALATRLDRAGAAVFVGQEIAITSGDGPIYVIMPLRRLPELSPQEFMHHWFDRHAALGEAVVGVRYRQNHIDQVRTQALAENMGLEFEPLDGMAESYFDSVDAAVAILSQEDVAGDAIVDEKRFIDHRRSQFGIYRTVWRG